MLEILNLGTMGKKWGAGAGTGDNAMAKAMVLSWATPFLYFLNKATRCTLALCIASFFLKVRQKTEKGKEIDTVDKNLVGRHVLDLNSKVRFWAGLG